ncbi:MAG: hypothetical protein E1N59_3072, partial [Puniceicoccaceae bacterium 5H]
PTTAPVTTPAPEPNPPQVVVAPSTAHPTPAPTPATPRKVIQAYLDEVQVRGVMSGGSKILLFDPTAGRSRAFAQGDLLSADPQIEIAEIKLNQIIFTDDAGVTYVKRF